MKRLDIISVMLLITLMSCTAQTKKSQASYDENSPKTNISVKKKYDKNGNVIGYDSTYTSVYSNIKGDDHLMDSLMNAFKSDFNDKYFFSNEPFFKNFFFNDSVPEKEFLKNDYFYRYFKRDMARMDSLFRGMDLMKNDFFNNRPEPNVIK
jgi:hypothetical protein